MLTGGLLIDKDAGMSSHDVVARLRRIAGQRQVGHTGTLDPMATGLMICLLGRATKLSPWLTHLDKTYECEAELGIETDTDDATGRVIAQSPDWPREPEAVGRALHQFLGEIDQIPPRFSAIHVEGRRLYDYARKGQEVSVPPRRVMIRKLDLLEVSLPCLRFRVEVSAGAYIRSLCRDLGRALGCGAHMKALRRETVGSFSILNAFRLGDLEEGGAEPALLAPPQLLPQLPCWQADAVTCGRLRQGRACEIATMKRIDRNEAGESGLVVDETGETVALIRIKTDDTPNAGPMGWPVKVF